MPGFNGNAEKQKAKNVLDQQKRVAALMAQQRAKQQHQQQQQQGKDNSKNITSSTSISSSNRPKPPPPPGKPPPPPKPPSQKRPSRPHKRPGSGGGSSSATSSSTFSILEKARAKVAGKPTSSLSSSSASGKKNSSETIDLTNSIAKQRPSITSSLRSENIKRKTKNGALSSLVGNMTASKMVDSEDSFGSSSGGYATNVSPDDFWKNLRDWDFGMDLAIQRQDERSNDTDTTRHKKKPLPDTFISSRHYISAWAPLCLAEARAQLISEALTIMSPFVLVDVETTWKEPNNSRRDTRGVDRTLHTDLMDIDSCHVKISTQRGQKGGKIQFFPHDVCWLIPEQSKDIIERLIRGSTKIQVSESSDAYKKLGLIGHTEVQRREVHGLILKVSKKCWARTGTKKMFLLRLGGTITSLREFTALCGVDNIPLKKYLLGNHLMKEGKRRSRANENISQPAEKHVLLKKMGGAEALGRGFTDYCGKKFNPSQVRTQGYYSKHRIWS